jgi:hypothetical protein
MWKLKIENVTNQTAKSSTEDAYVPCKAGDIISHPSIFWSPGRALERVFFPQPQLGWVF